MRSRKEIEKEAKPYFEHATNTKTIIELLLDIRELLRKQQK